MTSRSIAGGTIRRLWPGEENLLAAHLKRLDPESRACRFGGHVSDTAIDTYLRSAFGDGVVFGFFVEGTVRGAAELRGPPLEAEAAFSVEREWQGRGVGSALFGRLLQIAQGRGMRRFLVSCLAENGAMRRIAARHGARFSPGLVEIVGDVQPPAPTPWAVSREMMAAGYDAGLAGLDLQARVLRRV